MKTTKAKLVLFALILLHVSFAWSQPRTGFVIEDIELVGARRITLATVLTYMPVAAGDRLTAERSRQVLKALYETEFFKDVSLSRRGNVLVIEVKERPAIAAINIDGNKKLKDEDIDKAFDEMGLVQGRIYNDQVLDTMQKELERIYYSVGRYGVKLKSSVTPLPRNRVKIDIDIKEGLTAEIREINVVGNESYSDKEILSDFESRIPSWWAVFSTADQYAKEKLKGDKEKLESFYKDRGYADYELESVQVTISPDKKDIYITLNINEGGRFKIRNVDISGDTVVNKKLLRKIIKRANRKGEYFSNKNATDAVEYIVEALGNIGYAFAEVDVETKTFIDEDDESVVDLTFKVNPKKRVYVRRIEFINNDKAQDDVYRRELRQLEGAWYSRSAVERSKIRIQRLPFVEEIEVEDLDVIGEDDRLDVAYTIKERSAGTFNVGVGYSDENGAMISADVVHNNVFGRGNSVAVSVSRNEVISSFRYSYENPYYTKDGISRGFSLFATNYDTSDTLLTEYVVDTMGGRIFYQIPTSEFSAFRLGVGITGTEIQEQIRISSKEIREFIAEYGSDYRQLSLEGTYIYDTRNRSIFASAGMRQLLSLSVDPSPSDLEYYKLNYNSDFYWPVTRTSSLHAKVNLGLGEGFSGLDRLPFFEKYSTGGIRGVRGFEPRSLGPKATLVDADGNEFIDRRRVFGGDLLTVASLEYILPPPPKAAGSMRFLLFYDIGNVYEKRSDFDASELRSSVGVSLKWLAPIGAITFSYAEQLKKFPGDETENFQFTVGGTF